jgi:hypothetical protein
MKKIISYLFYSVIFALICVAIDIVTQKVILRQENKTLNSLGLDEINNLTPGISGISNKNINTATGLVGTCPDKTPLLLSDGQCVSCNDVNPAIQVGDILFGCEKCPNLKQKKITCVFKSETAQTPEKTTKQKPSKKTHKYDLISIIGTDDKIRATLLENQTEQIKIISIGSVLDEGIVKSISVQTGITVEKNGITKTLDIEM